jgi:hypothetical protein
VDKEWIWMAGNNRTAIDAATELVIALLASGKGPSFGNATPEEAKRAGEWLGHAYRAAYDIVAKER